MKNCFRLVIGAVLLCGTLTISDVKAQQVPQTLTYQSVLRNSNNVLMANTAVGIKISILQGNAQGLEMFSETQSVTTNANGLLSLQIGAGNAVTGAFSNIDWANGPYFIKTETDPTGGNNYSIVGTQQLASVPYALYAAKSGGNVFETTVDDPNAIHNVNTGNVGIGTDLPGEKLDVAGNLKVRQNVIVEGNNMTTGNSMVGQNLEVNGNIYTSNNLNVNGNVRIAGGQPAQGKVLTSDNNGIATWETPAAPDLSGLATTTDINNLQNQVNDQSTINQIQQNQINDLNTVNQTQDQSISDLSSQVQSNTSNISNIQAQTTMLQNGVDNLQLQVQSNTNDIVDLQIQNTQQSQQIDFLNVQNAGQSSQIDDLNSGLNTTNNQVQTNTSNISNLQVENNQQAVQISDLNTGLTNTYNQVQGNANNISNLQVENNLQSVQISDLNTGLTNTYNQVQGNTNNISNLQVENNLQSVQISDLNTGLTNTYNQVQGNTNNISNLQVENNLQAVQISDLNTGLTNTYNQVQSNTNNISNLQVENNQQAVQISDLNTGLTNTQSQVQINTTDNINQQIQIDDLNTGLSSTNNQVQTNTTDIINLQSQISNVQSNFVTTVDDPSAIHNVNTGNVGIGTDLPSEKLDVNGNLKVRQNATITGTLNIEPAQLNGSPTSPTSSSAPAQIHLQGSMGIGTNTPNALLNIVGGDRENSLRIESGNAGVALVSTREYQIFTRQQGDLAIYDQTAEQEPNGGYPFRMIINPLGKVGIGNQSPTEQLDVTGNIKSNQSVMANNFVKAGGQANEYLMADGSVSTGGTGGAGVFVATADNPDNISNVNAGNVGIGTDLPSEKLDVNGNLKVRGTIIAGENSTATGNSAFSMGRGTVASGDYSTAMGYNTVATGPQSTAFGVESNASGLHSLAAGYGTNASGTQSTTMGGATMASGVRSTAMGYLSNASGDASVAMGTGTKARSNSEVALGMNNTDYQPGSTEGFVATDRLFVIGNGTDENNKSNAMVVLKNGNTTINGTTTANSFVKAGGTSSEYLMADGSTSTGGSTTSMGSISLSSNANGGTIDAGVLSLAPADATYGGVVTTETQTFAGNKTFNNNIQANSFVKSGGTSSEYLMADGSTSGGWITRPTVVIGFSFLSPYDFIYGNFITAYTSQLFLPSVIDFGSSINGGISTGLSIEFYVYNNASATVQLVLGSGMSTPVTAAISGSANMNISTSQKLARFRIVFLNSSTAMIFRIN